MRLKVFVLLVVLVLPSVCIADPHLTCDNYSTSVVQPTYFKISMDGGAYVGSTAVKNPDGSVKLWYDLATVTQGSHTAKAQACNLWGCSIDSNPFAFVRSVPGVPANMAIK